ncbi:MAG: TonB-dependent receptor [Steroidobacteraceae bacterium]
MTRESLWSGRRIALALTGPLSLVASAVAYAQQPADTDGSGLEEIIVTAERRAVDLQKSAVALTVVSGDEMARSGVTQFRDMLQSVPSVSLQNEGSTKNAPAVAIRGIGVDGANKQLSTAIYEDGVVVNNQTGQFYDLARIEVLRGPQGTLYGATAVGGAVNIISNDPKQDLEASTSLEVGNQGLLHVTGMGNVPVTDTLAVRGAFNMYRKSTVTNAHILSTDYINARLKTLYKPNEKFSALIGLNYVQLLPGGNGTGMSEAGYVDTPTGDLTKKYVDQRGNYGSRRVMKYWANLDYDFGFATLSYLPAFQRSYQDGWSLGNVASTNNIGEVVLHYYHTDTHELRLVSNADSKLTWVSGFYYLRRYFDRDELGGMTNVTGSTPRTITTVHHIILSLGLYGQATYAFTDSTRLTLGARESSDDVFQTTHNMYPTGTDTEKFTLYHEKTHNFTYLVRAEHDLTPRNMLYASISNAYRPGGLGALGTSYEPETMKAYEIGSKNRFGSRLVANISAFYYDYPAMQTPQSVCSDYPVCAAGNVVGNITMRIPTTFWGLELESILQLSPNDRFTFAPAYLHARYTGNVNLTDPRLGSTGELTTDGQAPPHAPTWTMSAGYNHIFRIGDKGSLDMGVNARYETEQYTGFDVQVYRNTFNKRYQVQKAFTALNANITWAPASDKYSVTAWGRNLTDVRYRIGGGSVTAQVNDPRSYGLQFNTKFF